MGEVTLTINTLELIKTAASDLDKAIEKIKTLEGVVVDKKKAKKVKKSAELLEAATIAIKSLEQDLY